MRLQHATWEEVDDYLKRSSGVVIPLGSTEQHGPLGLIGTDALCAEAIAEGLGQRAGALVGPTIALGAAQFNLAFPGTVSLRASTLMALITDYVSSLARQGFERFYFINGHGGNIAPALAAIQDLYAASSLDPLAGPAALRCRVRSWWQYPSADRLRRELFGEWEGMHATPSEVAITQALYPESARRRDMPKPEKLSSDFLRDHAGDNHFDAVTHQRRFPDGRVGSDSSLATEEHGRALIRAAIDDADADYRVFLAEP